MKLSEAIREGIRKDGRQIFGAFYEYENGLKLNVYTTDIAIIGCCTIGAALIGINAQDMEEPCESFPELKQRVNIPCGCEMCYNNIGDIIVHLNDKERWSREKIADWLEGIGE